MLYLIQSGEYVKIGYTYNIHTRIQNYQTHNPEIKFLGAKQGDLSLEQKYHTILKDKLVKGEWFKLPQYMIDYLCKHHFTIKEETTEKKPKKIYKVYKPKEQSNKPFLLLKQLYNKIVLARITKDLSILEFTPQEENLLIQTGCYKPSILDDLKREAK